MTIFKSDNGFYDQPMNVWSLSPTPFRYMVAILLGWSNLREPHTYEFDHPSCWEDISKIYTLQIFINMTTTRKNVYNHNGYCIIVVIITYYIFKFIFIVIKI